MPLVARMPVSRPPGPCRVDDPAAAWYAKGNAYFRHGKQAEAIAAYDKALQLRPAFPQALRAGAIILRDSGSIEDALRFLSEAIRLDPTYLDAVLDRGNLLHALGRREDALATFEAASSLLPGQASLLCNRGALLHSLGRLPEACGLLEAAIAADPSLAQAHLNYAGVLMHLYRHEEALPVLDRAIALQPTLAGAHANRGLTLKVLGRFNHAAEAIDRAVALEPENPYALTNRGELRLLRGDLKRGFADYQHRFATEWHVVPSRNASAPLWSGQALSGLRIVAVADAGFGDIIQFARYLPMLVASGAERTVVCRPRIQRLLSTLLHGTRVVADVDKDERFDYLIPFSSLPFVFSATLDTIPCAPYLRAEPARVETWRKRIGPHGIKIGLCWRGSQSWRADPHRSIALEAFRPLAVLPGVRLISLYVGDDGGTASFPLERFDDADTGPDGFVDTAAMMTQLDHIVTIDTSIAHLAGALARPTHLLLQKASEWRWLLERDDTPWYPTTRLFRQETPGRWDDPIAHLVGVVAAGIGER